jgi:hypothetical protein
MTGSGAPPVVSSIATNFRNGPKPVKPIGLAADVDAYGILHHLAEKTRRGRGAEIAALRRCPRE